MTPDEAHDDYFQQNPVGNHDKPSRRTLELFAELERRLSENIDRESKALAIKIEENHKEVDKKMDNGTFWTVFGIQLTVLCGLIGWLAMGISTLNTNLQKTREEFVEVKTNTLGIETQLRNLDLIK